MGCLLVMFGAFFPRLAVIFIWLARPIYFEQAIGSAFVALIGSYMQRSGIFWDYWGGAWKSAGRKTSRLSKN